jgi:SAM-dependent methyltransferase
MNCDRLAPYYETLERIAFGRKLEACRFAFLDHTKSSKCAFLCGDGDGRFLAKLLSASPFVEVDFVDSSSKMLELAERRAFSLGSLFRSRVRFHLADIREFTPNSPAYDLVATHFFLDCFDDSELPQLVRRIAAWTTADSQWLLSDFREAPGTLPRFWTRAVIRSLYAAFHLTTGLQVTHIPNYRAALINSGFVSQLEFNLRAGLLHSSLWTRVHGASMSSPRPTQLERSPSYQTDAKVVEAGRF